MPHNGRLGDEPRILIASDSIALFGKVITRT